MSARHRPFRSSLTAQFVVFLLAFTLVPMLSVSLLLIGAADRALDDELGSAQRAVAFDIAGAVNKNVFSLKSLVQGTAGIATLAQPDQAAQSRVLGIVLERHPVLLELSVISPAGLETARQARFLKRAPELRRLDREDFFVAAMERGLFMGRLEPVEGTYPAMTVAAAIPGAAGKPAGVLAAKLSLGGLSQLLETEFPRGSDSSAAVVGPEGLLIAHSNPEQVVRPDAKLDPELNRVIAALNARSGGGPANLSGGKRLRGAFVRVPGRQLGWGVFVEKSAAGAGRTLRGMLWRTGLVLLLAMACAVPIAWSVARNVTRPIRDLRDAADLVAQGRFDEAERLLPLEVDNDVGELAERFEDMRAALKARTAELTQAKEKLENAAHALERRVEARTRELKAAQEALLENERIRLAGERLRLAEAMVDAGELDTAWREILAVPKEQWSSREYAFALRVLQRQGRFDEAVGLFGEARGRIQASQAPDLYYYFGILCERAGRVEEARRAFASIVSAMGAFRDVVSRVRRLEGLPTEDLARLSTMLGADAARTRRETAPVPGEEADSLVAGRFLILKTLGVGGMGAVYLARDRTLSREVALKRVHDDIARDPEARRAFADEAATVAALSHPYIVSLHDVLLEGGRMWIVFEYVEGETLLETVARRGRLPPAECAAVLDFALQALAHAHAKEVIHGDIKPSNLMRDRRGFVKLMDFGVARRARRPPGAGEKSVSGTPAYMAPEQHQGMATYRSDLYCVGATAYELLTGRSPFHAAGLEALHALKATERYEPLPDEVPADLREFVAACLKADPSARPADVAALRGILAKPAPAQS